MRNVGTVLAMSLCVTACGPYHVTGGPHDANLIVYNTHLPDQAAWLVRDSDEAGRYVESLARRRTIATGIGLSGLGLFVAGDLMSTIPVFDSIQRGGQLSPGVFWTGITLLTLGLALDIAALAIVPYPWTYADAFRISNREFPAAPFVIPQLGVGRPEPE